VASGQLLQDNFESIHDFTGYQLHREWDGYSLVYGRKTHKQEAKPILRDDEEIEEDTMEDDPSSVHLLKTKPQF